MESDYNRLLGSADSQQGILPGVHSVPERQVLESSCLQGPATSHNETPGHPAPPPDSGSGTGSPTPKGQGGVLGVFLGSQEEWRLACHSGFKMVEPLPKKEEVQDGDMEIHSGLPSKGQFHGLFGSHRGLPPCPHPRKTSTVPPVLLWNPSLPVQGLAIWTDGCPQGVHQAPGSCGGTLEESGNRSTPVSGRCPDPGVVLRTDSPGHPEDNRMSHQGGVSPQSAQKPSDPHSVPGAPGASLGHQTFLRLSLPRETAEASADAVVDIVQGGLAGDVTCRLTGADGFVPGCHPLVTFPSAPSPGFPGPLLTSDRVQGQQDGSSDTGSKRQPKVVAGRGQAGTMHQPGSAGSQSGHNGRITAGVGGSPRGPHTPGPMDTKRVHPFHQLAGTQGDPTGIAGLSSHVVRIACPCENGQHDCEGLCQQARGHTFSVPGGGESSALPVGGVSPSIAESRAPCGRGECHGRLAQPTTSERCGVETPSGGFSGLGSEMGSTDPGSLCDARQHANTTIPHPSSHTGGNGNRRVTIPLAQGTPLCLPASQSSPSTARTDQGPGSGGDTGCSTLAQEAVVLRRHKPLSGTRVATARPIRSTKPRPSVSSEPGSAPSDSLEVERQALSKKGYSSRVIKTIMASRRDSTSRTYDATWRKFRSWCLGKKVHPMGFSSNQFLEFLQDGLEMGLSTSTIRRQVSALRSTLRYSKCRSALFNSEVARFLKGVRNNNPPTVHRFPSWDLHLVLGALERTPFEPMATVDLKLVSYKTILLVALTSARRVSELGALSVNPNLCIFHRDKVVLRVDPSFIPKVNTWFHRSQDLVVPSFCPNPSTNSELDWHKLDVRRALKFYIERTKLIRKTDSLFIHFQGKSTGLRPANSTLARWMTGAIVTAYQALGKLPPAGITAHSVRSAATSAAFEGIASLESICRAATWSNPSTFTKHYKIDQAASAEAAFGRRVLQKVVSV